MVDEEITHHDENTLRKVYQGLLEAGIYGEQAVAVVSNIQNQGIFFRERKPKRRGRPPKPVEKVDETKDDKIVKPSQNGAQDAWSPNEGEVSGVNGN